MQCLHVLLCTKLILHTQHIIGLDHFTSLISSSISSFLNILKFSALVTVANSTLVEFSFSSMTCLRIVKACTHASFNVIDLWYTSCSVCCAPSDAEPIAFASYCKNVPDGSK